VGEKAEERRVAGSGTPAAPVTYGRFFHTTWRTVVLSLRLIWEEGPVTLERLSRALASPEIQHHLAFEFQWELLRLNLRRQAPPPGELDLQALAHLGQHVARHHLPQLLLRDPTIRRLEASWREVERELRRTPAGLWVDEHKEVVYFIGTVVLLGGGVGMYLLRRGDPIARHTTPLARFKHSIGTLKIGAGITRFVPSRRRVEGSVQLEGNWQPLPLQLNISGLLTPNRRRLSLAGTLWWKRDFPLSLGGHLQLDSEIGSSYRLGLGFRQQRSGLSLDLRVAVRDSRALDLRGGFSYCRSSGPSPYSLRVGFGYGAPLSSPLTGRAEIAVLFRLDF